MKTATVRSRRLDEIMTRDVVVILEDQGVMTAMDTALMTGLRHFVVVDERGRARGLVTSEALATALLSHAVAARSLLGVMTTCRTVMLPPHATVQDAAQHMLDELVDAVVVVNEERTVLGIVTWSDIVRLVVA